MLRQVLAGLALATLTLGLAVAQEAADTASPRDTELPDTATPEDTGDTGDPPPPSRDSVPEEESPDTGDTGDEPEDQDPCEGLGLFVGDLVFSTQRALDQFGQDYNAVRGDLRIVGGEIQDLSPLDCLTAVEGDLTIAAQPDSAPLERLERVTGALRLVQTPMEELLLPALVQAGSLEIEANPALLRVKAPQVQGLRALVLTQNPRLGTLELPPLTLPEGLAISRTGLRHPPTTLAAGRVALEDNPALRSLDGLEPLAATDELVLSGNPNLVDLEGLASLTVVRGELFLRDNGFADLSGLASLTVVGNLSVLDHDAMSALALPSLAVVGELRVERGASLSSLDLPRLVRAERLVVKECPSLVGFGLPQLLRAELELRGLRNLSSLDGLEGLLVAPRVLLAGNERLSDVEALHGARIDELTVDSNKRLREKEVEALRAATQPPG